MGRYRRWECALLLALALTAVWGAASLQRQESLAQKTIRLHVIANSDSEADQRLKLQVRDSVLAAAESALCASQDMAQARSRLGQMLPALQRQAQEEVTRQGYDYAVTASLEETEFPLRTYEGFALPSGRYLALRVVIGEGQGRNWWCVVFPPLCTAAASELSETASSAGWEAEDIRLVTESGEGYVIRFRAVELWEQLRQHLHR